MDIQKILYDYARAHSMNHYLQTNETYCHQSMLLAQQRQQELRKLLDDETFQRLIDYVDGVQELYELKLEAMFRAGLSMGRELFRL